MVKVLKRNGKSMKFNSMKIFNAVKSAMADSKSGFDAMLCGEIMMEAQERINNLDKDMVKVDEIQNIVEEVLFDKADKEVYTRYAVYRHERNQHRNSPEKKEYKLLDDEFISDYKHDDNPIKSELGKFVYNRTYSRFLPNEGRREMWWETARRAIEYNCSLAPTPKEEAQELFDNVYNLRQFPSGRTLWVGGTPVATDYPMSNFNCSFTVIDNFESFKDLFYLLMLGSGVGVRILKSDVAKLPNVRTDYEIIHEEYVHETDKKDNTSFIPLSNETIKIKIGDSKEGWKQAIGYYFELLYSHEFKHIKTIIFNYNFVRPKGEKLVTFGGTASGYESLKNMFVKINKVIENSEGKLRPIHCLDIANIIGENVVSGGVRRTAEIVLIDADDTECIEAKSNLYTQVGGEWQIDKNIKHRQMSNNSIFYQEKPTREQLHWNFEQIKTTGEPAFVNQVAMLKRRQNAEGVNPCGEIILDSKQQCNLVTINVCSCVKDDNTLDYELLYRVQWLSARMALRMTCVDLELPEWSNNQQRDRLTGCSMTGWQDMVNAVKLTKEDEAELLRELKRIAREASEEYADELGIEHPILITTTKPEGTISQIPTVSSGVHYSHSPYFIRRVRISATDPLCKVCEELGYPVFPEVGQDEKTCVTKYVEFPVKAPEGKTKFDVTAIEQLEEYKMFMDNYVEHNCSITVTVRPNEWESVEQWMWDNWDDVVGISFLALNDEDHQHEAMPYEAIDEEEYNRRVAEMKPFISSLISKYEVEEMELDIGNESCATGACPTR